MAVTSESTTVWNGDLIHGSGTVSLDSSHAAVESEPGKQLSSLDRSANKPHRKLDFNGSLQAIARFQNPHLV